MKKNKKTILLAAGGGGGLLVLTSIAIVIPVVLTSSNSDEQTIKEAQVALEKLTLAQTTVNLAKVTNQQLPSAFKISSMETLNALLNKPIITLDGIIYMPQVIRTNNIRGEMVVEIEIKKGTIKDKLQFIVSGFKKQTKKDLNNEDLKVIKLTTTLTQVEDVVSIETAKETMTKVANLVTKNEKSEVIDATKLKYEVVFVSGKGLEQKKDDFQIDGSELNLKANKTLDNGDIIFVVSVKLINSTNAPINYIPFTITIVPSPIIVTTVSGTPISEFTSIEKAIPDTPKVANLTTRDQRGNEITSELTYEIVSAMQSDSNIDHKFEIVGSVLRLKSGKTLLVGDIDFVISAKLEGGQTVDSDSFILLVPASTLLVKKVIGTPVDDLVSIETTTPDTPKIADLTTRDQRRQIINVAKLTYAIVSVKQGSSDISDKFKIVGSELRLEANKTLEAGNIEFVVSAKLTSSSDVLTNSDSFIVAITPSISNVKKIVGKEVAFVSIETSRSKMLTITNLITTNQREEVINVANLRYAIVSATQGSSDISDKFKIVGSELRLEANKTLEAGDISFVASAQLKSSSDAPVNSVLFIVSISPPIKSVEITEILFDDAKVVLPIDKSTNIATIVIKDKNEKIILATNLDYQIVSVIKKKLNVEEDIDVSKKFEINNGILKLKAGETMIGWAKFSFVVSAQLKGGTIVNSKKFDVKVERIIKSVKVWPIPIPAYILPSDTDIVVAILSVKDFSNKNINSNNLISKIVSAQQGESKINVKQKFKTNYKTEISLKSGEDLGIEDVEFVISVQYNHKLQIHKFITFIVPTNIV